MATYRTIQGDTWDQIAYKQYQDESIMTQLINMNPEYTETAVFSAGVVLQLPDEIMETATSLPPWRV